jgi:hypothetical protein
MIKLAEKNSNKSFCLIGGFILFILLIILPFSQAIKVECAYNSDCSANQICDTNTYTCTTLASGKTMLEDNFQKESTDNSLNSTLIIAGAIIAGFILLAVVLNRRNKK